MVTMFCKRIGAIHKKGRDQLEALREAHRAESERLPGVFGEVLSVVREAVTPAGTESEDPQPGGGTAETSAPDGTAAAEQAGRLVLKTLGGRLHHRGAAAQRLLAGALWQPALFRDPERPPTGNPAVFSSLSPLAVPLLLVPRLRASAP